MDKKDCCCSERHKDRSEEEKKKLMNREFDSCIHFSTNQIAQNVDYINAFEFFYCQIRQNKCRIM